MFPSTCLDWQLTGAGAAVEAFGVRGNLGTSHVANLPACARSSNTIFALGATRHARCRCSTTPLLIMLPPE